MNNIEAIQLVDELVALMTSIEDSPIELEHSYRLVPSKPSTGKRWTLYRPGHRRPVAYVDDIEDAQRIIGDRHHG